MVPINPNVRNGSKADIRQVAIFLSYRASPVLGPLLTQREDALLHLAKSRRPCRAGEWTEARAVTFIVTLAATRSVTLAAARASMSRKAAYALKERDAHFAAAWKAALAASASKGRGGDKIDEVYRNRVGRVQGNKSTRSGRRILPGNARRDSFENLWNVTIESACPSLAREATLP